MLDRSGIHHDQRRMDDRPGIHQRARQCVAARLDHAGKGAADHIERMRRGIERKHADRQPLGADGDGDLERSVLARQPGQRAGLGKADAGADCRRRAPPWRRSSSRRWPAAGTPPGHRPDAARSACAISGCAKAGAGHRINSAPLMASAMSVVTSASCTSWRPLTSLTRMREPAARCCVTCAASRRHSLTSWPCKAKSPAAANEPLPPPSTAIFKWLLLARPAGASSRRSMKCCTLPRAPCAAGRRRKRYRAAP